MSRLNQQNALNYGNKETHIFTEFGTLAKENTQQQVLDAIKNINLNVGEIVIGDISVQSNDVVTHEKLDTLNTTLSNKTLSKTTSSIDISNQSINIGNFPATQAVSGSVNVGNFPTTQAVSGSVNVGNFPATQPVSGSVSISSLPAIAITNTSFEVSNFPTTQAVSGSVNVGNFPTTQAVSGSVNVGNFPATQAVSGSVSINNSLIDVNNIGSITDAPFDLLLNGPTLWADSTPLVNPFTADPNGREGWYYDNFNNIANLSNIYWYANPVSGNLQENDMTFLQMSGMYCVITCDYVENGSLTIPTMTIYSQPTGVDDIIPNFAHSRWIYQLNATNRAKLRKAETIMLYTGSTRPTAYPTLPAYEMNIVSVNIGASTSEIIAYLSINTQATTSKIGYLLQYAGYLNSTIGYNREYQFLNSKERVIQNNQYSNTVDVDGLTFTGNNLNVNVAAGSISVSSVNIKDSAGNNLNSTSNALNSYITNTSVDTRCYASSNGTTWHHLSSDANGQLNIHSKTQSGAGTDITSTLNGAKQSLDVNVSNTVPVSGSVSISNTVAVSGTVYAGFISDITKTSQAQIPSKVFLDVMADIKALNNLGGGNNDIMTCSKPDAQKTGNTVSSATTALDTNAFLSAYNPSTGLIKLVTMDESVGSKRALDVNVVNSSSSAVQITNGTINAGITSTIANVASSNGLVANAVNYGLTNTGTISPITSLINGAKNQLETRDNDAVAELTSINTKTVQQYNTTNDSGVIGVNIYGIRPKVRFYNMRGISTVADVNMLLGSVSSSRYFYSDNYSIANLKPWWAYSEAISRTINYEYVDGAGNILNASKVIPATTWTRLPNAVGVDTNFLINKWSTTPNQTTTSGNVYISHTSPSSAYSMFGGNYADTFQANFTVPTGYVACITNVSFFSNAGDDYTILLKWDENGNRSTVFYWSTVKILNENYYNQYGGVGGVYTSGQSIGWGMLNSASNKNFSATIMCMPV